MSQKLRSLATLLFYLVFLVAEGDASPFLPAGDTVLRNDIQWLADHGVIRAPVTTWPLAWGPILADIAAYEFDESTPSHVVAALERVQQRASWDTRR